jgi:hypothetical protein
MPVSLLVNGCTDEAIAGTSKWYRFLKITLYARFSMARLMLTAVLRSGGLMMLPLSVKTGSKARRSINGFVPERKRNGVKPFVCRVEGGKMVDNSVSTSWLFSPGAPGYLWLQQFRLASISCSRFWYSLRAPGLPSVIIFFKTTTSGCRDNRLLNFCCSCANWVMNILN